MSNMCDGDFYDPIEGKPSVMESHYTYYLWADEGVSLPNDKHKIINNWEQFINILAREEYPQFSVDARGLSSEELTNIIVEMFRLGGEYIFIWRGGLRAIVEREEYKEKLLPTKWYFICSDPEMHRANYEKHPNLESLLKVLDLNKFDPSVYIDDRDITGREFSAMVDSLKDLGVKRIYRTNCFQSIEI